MTFIQFRKNIPEERIFKIRQRELGHRQIGTVAYRQTQIAKKRRVRILAGLFARNNHQVSAFFHKFRQIVGQRSV